MKRLLVRFVLGGLAVGLLFGSAAPLHAQTYVYLTEVPDYNWWAGCFGTASGNLGGFWDRHGLPDLYTGPTTGGVAPLHDAGDIRSLWASQANVDGRPADLPGHMDDYYVGYQVTGDDPYVTAGRTEHSPDCIGDFIGLSQRKWTNLNKECAGNIDAYSFVFWDKTGARRNNHYTTNAGAYIPDIGSGLREWARYRGYDADVFTQLSSFNPERTTTNGFTYEDVKAEILAGFPVLCFLQPQGQYSRTLNEVPGVNPEIHGVLAFGVAENVAEIGADKGVLIRTSWASGDGYIMEWTSVDWLGLFPVRGVIGFHPKPKIRQFSRDGGNITLAWDGPSTQLHDGLAGTTSPPLQRYRVQRASSLNPPDWEDVSPATTDRTATVSDGGLATTFYRVVLLPPGSP